MGAGSWEVNFLLSDHLGSTSITTDDSGDTVSEMRYSPWGSVRFSDGVSPTDYQFNGHLSKVDHFGLIYFHARWFDPSLGRFSSPDTMISNPNNVLEWDRYQFVLSNPIRYVDPSGHQSKPPGNYDYWYPELRIAVALNVSPGINVSPGREIISNIMNVAQLHMGFIESIISIEGSAQPGGILLLGELAAQLEPSLGGEVAIAVLANSISIPADIFEDIPGWFDVGLNLLGDAYGGTTYFDKGTNELVIGQDTFISLLEQGIDLAIPSVWADLLLNLGATAYDLLSVFGFIPDFIELRVSIDDPSNYYIVIYPDALPHGSDLQNAIYEQLDAYDRINNNGSGPPPAQYY